MRSSAKGPPRILVRKQKNETVRPEGIALAEDKTIPDRKRKQIPP
jgi:hypothetical protein